MEKIQLQSIPKSTQLINVTPEALRHIADRLEHLSRSTLPGHEITFDFTRSVSFIYTPDMSTERFLRLTSTIDEVEHHDV